MSVAKIHLLGPVVFNTDVLGGIIQQNAGLGAEVRGEPTSGDVYTRHQSLVALRVAGSFTTLAIRAATLLSGPPIGKSIADLAAGLMMYGQKVDEGGTRAAGSVHTRYTMVEGIIVPRILSCEFGGDASLTYDVIVSYDGVNDPIVKTENNAMPSASSDAERFTLGPIEIESVTLAQCRSFSLNFGIDVRLEDAEKDIYPTFPWVASVKPVLTLRGIDTDWFKSSGAFPLNGKAVAHANTNIYLTKRAVGGTFSASSDHLKLSMAGLATITAAMDAGASDQPAEATLELPCFYDGTNAPVTLTTGSLP